MRKPLIAANWKMNGTLETNQKLVGALVEQLNLPAVDILICPPAVYISQVQSLVSKTDIRLGGQTLNQHDAGAFTGEISALMLKDLGCSYVILGHSERRTIYAETDACVAAKFIAAVAAGLVPVLCVGETLEERQQEKTLQVIERQISEVVKVAGIEAFKNAVVAYEPVWAIGTGKTATPEQAQDIHAAIRGILANANAAIAAATRILYGGSVNAANAATLFAEQDIDGGLIGGASLKPDDFISICQAADA